RGAPATSLARRAVAGGCSRRLGRVRGSSGAAARRRPGWPSYERLEVGAHLAVHAAYARRLHHLGGVGPRLRSAHVGLEGFQEEVVAELVAVVEQVGEGLLGRVDLESCRAGGVLLDPVMVDAFGEVVE